MTDARFPDRWLHDRRLMQLSAEAFRAHVCAMAWSVSNRSDGVIAIADLELMPWIRGSLDELMTSGLLTPREESGWLLAEFMTTQSTRAQMEAYDQNRLRRLEHDRERKEKARKASKQTDPVHPEVQVEVQADTVSDHTREAVHPEVQVDVRSGHVGKATARPGQAEVPARTHTREALGLPDPPEDLFLGSTSLGSTHLREDCGSSRRMTRDGQRVCVDCYGVGSAVVRSA